IKKTPEKDSYGLLIETKNSYKKSHKNVEPLLENSKEYKRSGKYVKRRTTKCSLLWILTKVR
ncbi:hypothetical protein HHI36_014828, partial [Cryptolaemus montrouzieri]